MAKIELEEAIRRFEQPASPTGERAAGFDFYGGARQMLDANEHQVILAGPSETGKTLACLFKVHNIALANAGAQLVIVRKTYKSMPGTVLRTYERSVLNPTDGVHPYGGSKPEWYDYPNGSRVWVGGLDNPDRVLSSERDMIYVNQVEELTLDDWEILSTRVTGRSAVVKIPQLLGDCNPSHSQHWIRGKASDGTIRLLESRHEDNPTLFDPKTGEITEQGKKTLKILESLTGARKARLRFGLWASAEGMVYEDVWNAAIHIIDRFEIPDSWPRYLSIDFGYKNPFVCAWWAEDGDGRLYRYREIYKTETLVEDHAAQIKSLCENEPRPQALICDHDAEGRATLERYLGMSTIAAYKAIEEGIQAVAARLRKAGDDKPRIFFMRDSLVERDPRLDETKKPACTEEEIESYVYPKGQDGKPLKEVPVKENDHGMDQTRYMVMYKDNNGPTLIIDNPLF